MAVAQGYGKTITSGSVFAYDTGDTVNSYRGEPTVNQYTNPDFSNGTTGWAFASWDGNVTYTTEAVTGPFGKTINALKLTKNATSAYSHFHQYNSGKYTTGNQYTLSAWVKGTGTFRGNTQWGGIVQSFTLTGDWQYVQYTVTAPNNDNFPYWAAEALTTGTVFYMVYAQSEQKSHATPFVSGTRSATQGLLPLVGNTSLDLSNVSFDSNAQMTFDGTNDYLDFIAPNLSGTATIEMLCKIGSGYADKMFFGWSAYDVWCGGGHLGYNTANGDVYGISSSTVSSLGLVNNWKHYIFEMRSDVSYTNNKIYVNGTSQTLSQQQSAEYVANRNFNSGNGRIADWRITGYYMPMDCAVFKVYNRILSAAEVRQNYLQYKTRFNLS